MLTIETEKKLADLLWEILNGEKRVEEARFSLCNNPEFELLCAFKELDRIRMGSISSHDIRYFLDKNRVVCSNEEAYLIVKQYDNQSNGRLSLSEFSKLAMPNFLPAKYGQGATFSRISLDAEFLLTKLLENEVRYHRTLEALKRELIERADFNLMEAFRSLDKRNYSHIDCNALYVFLKRNGYFICEMDTQHIMNRIDRDLDGILNYIEFVDAVLPFGPHSRNRSPTKLSRNATPLKQSWRSSYLSSPEARSQLYTL